jgi:hypothetical protein
VLVWAVHFLLLSIDDLCSNSIYTFLADDGQSVDAILFYGNEPTLLVFDILLFCIVDLIAMDYILAAIITFLFDEVSSCNK